MKTRRPDEAGKRRKSKWSRRLLAVIPRSQACAPEKAHTKSEPSPGTLNRVTWPLP